MCYRGVFPPWLGRWWWMPLSSPPTLSPNRLCWTRVCVKQAEQTKRLKLNTDNNNVVLRVFSGYFGDDILCHFCASMISGLVTTAASMPVDIVKTRWGSGPEKHEFCLEQFSERFSWNICVCLRIQNMRMIDGKPEYKNGLVSDVFLFLKMKM